MGRRVAGPSPEPERATYKPRIELAEMMEQLRLEDAERDAERYAVLKAMATHSSEEQAEYRKLHADQKRLKAQQKAAGEDRVRLARMSPSERGAVMRQRKDESARALAEIIQTMKNEQEQRYTS
jgi:hypothetical protein